MNRAIDINGRAIQIGDLVHWYDPEGITSGNYEVYDIHSEEMVCLSDGYSELEALPSECMVLRSKEK